MNPAGKAAELAMKTPELLNYLWVPFLAAWGGAANYLRRPRAKIGTKRFFQDMAIEMFISGFAGVLTYALCLSVGMSDFMAAAFVGISGHISSRSLFLMGQVYQSQFPLPKEATQEGDEV